MLEEPIPQAAAGLAYRRALVESWHTCSAMRTTEPARRGASLPDALPNRTEFVRLIPHDAEALEIGPFYTPLLTGPAVRYFDVMDHAALRERAVRLGKPTERIPPRIHYVEPHGDLSIVTERFDFVLSSHVIEHQPDLIGHLRDVARILRPKGKYLALIPDRRYCLDHFIAPSTIADVIDAHVAERRAPTLRARLQHVALTTHNDRRRHWRGDHGRPNLDLDRIRRTVAEYRADSERYVDVHAWHFEPDSFDSLMSLSNALGLSPFHAVKIYPTMPGQNEFWAVLARADEVSREVDGGTSSQKPTGLEQLGRRLSKLRRDPVRFLADSRFEWARRLARRGGG